MTDNTAEALELALWLYRAPSRRAALLERPLSAGTGQLIRIASGSPEVLREAALAAGEPEPTVLEAVRFYLQQILFHEQADAYRVMGLEADASHAQIREHHRWLQRWLHPDRRGEDWESVYASRVNEAWSQLRTPQSRQDYDAARPLAAQAPERASRAAPRALPTQGWTGDGGGQRSRNVAIAALLGCLALIALIALRREQPPQWLETSLAGVEASAGTAVPAPTPLNDALMREALIRDVQMPAPPETTGSQATPDAPAGARHARDAVAVRPVVTESRATTTDALVEAGHARDAVAVRPAAAESRAWPAPADARTQSQATTPDAPAGAGHARDVLAVRTAAVASSARGASVEPQPIASRAAIDLDPDAARPRTTATDPPIDPLLQMRQARTRAQQIVAYLADPAVRAPPVWNDLATALHAEELRDALHGGADDARGRGLVLNTQNWSLAGDRASLAAGYRLTDRGGVSSHGRIAIDFVWRDNTCLVKTLSLEPAS